MLHRLCRHPSIAASLSPLLSFVFVFVLAAMMAMTVLGGEIPAEQDAKPAGGAAAVKRTVLITGANRGLGLEFARQYHEAGWDVIATARDPDAAADLKALGVSIEALDVADAASVAAMAQRLQGRPIDLLINNAGIAGGPAGRLEGAKMDDFERTMQVNTSGPMRVTQALLANLRAGQGKMVVSISSKLGSIELNTGGRSYGYCVSKAALNMFMRNLAAELRGAGFICIAMSPGWVQTDLGGPSAQLTPEQSIKGMKKVIDGLKPEDSGKFWNHEGAIVPW